MTAITQRYSAIPIGVDGSVKPGSAIGGFLAKTSGALTLTDGHNRILIDAIPVTAGLFTPMPFATGGPGSTVTLSGGASGTLAAG